MPTTPSSISASEPASAPEAATATRWTRFACEMLAGAAILFAVLFLAIVAIDPYDTGRFALIRKPGVPAQGPRTADASRGRDPDFDGAIFGNSHIQLIAPDALKAATGIPFVTLSIPGTGPKEHLLMLDYFLRNRVRTPKALVIGADGYWCTPDPALPNWNPFPFWLYDRSAWRYLAGLMRWQVFDESLRRIQYVIGGSRQQRARRDGWWNYDEGVGWWPPERGTVDLGQTDGPAVWNPTGTFPAIEALGERLAALPASLDLVVVRPPIFISGLPAPGSEAARQDAACRDALAAMLARRPRSTLVDWQVDRAETRDPANFRDHSHYRIPLARLVEADIASAIKTMGQP